LLNYPLRSLVVDDNVSFKLAALKVYPKTIIQACTNHFKENVRRVLKTRSDETYRPFIKELEFLFIKKRSKPEFDSLAGKIYQRWKNNELAVSIIIDMAKRRSELLAYTSTPQTPYTTNLIEAYNSHLQARLRNIKSFANFSYAKKWLNAYILKRRLTRFTDCRGKFRKLNGSCSLKITLQDNQKLPSFFK
jgi:transposase-like protein